MKPEKSSYKNLSFEPEREIEQEQQKVLQVLQALEELYEYEWLNGDLLVESIVELIIYYAESLKALSEIRYKAFQMLKNLLKKELVVALVEKAPEEAIRHIPKDYVLYILIEGYSFLAEDMRNKADRRLDLLQDMLLCWLEEYKENPYLTDKDLRGWIAANFLISSNKPKEQVENTIRIPEHIVRKYESLINHYRSLGIDLTIEDLIGYVIFLASLILDYYFITIENKYGWYLMEEEAFKGGDEA